MQRSPFYGVPSAPFNPVDYSKPFTRVDDSAQRRPCEKRKRPESMDRPPSRSGPSRNSFQGPPARPTLPGIRATLPEQFAPARRQSMSGMPTAGAAYPYGQPSATDSYQYATSGLPPTSYAAPPARRMSFSGQAPSPAPPARPNGVAQPQAVCPVRQTVAVACTNCRNSHLACSHERPCQRCVTHGRQATCVDVEPRRRGRPRNSEPGVETAAQIPMHVSQDPVMPIILCSTSLRCARITNAVCQFLGFGTTEMLEEPLSTFIHPDEKTEYARWSLRILAYPGVQSRPVPVSFNRLHQTSFTELLAPIPDAPCHRHTFRVRTKRTGYERVHLEAYLGGGFGAHPSNRESLKLAYVIIKLSSPPATTSTSTSSAATVPVAGPSSMPMGRRTSFSSSGSSAAGLPYQAVAGPGPGPVAGPSTSAVPRPRTSSMGASMYAGARPPSRSGGYGDRFMRG